MHVLYNMLCTLFNVVFEINTVLQNFHQVTMSVRVVRRPLPRSRSYWCPEALRRALPTLPLRCSLQPHFQKRSVELTNEDTEQVWGGERINDVHRHDVDVAEVGLTDFFKLLWYTNILR